MLQNLIILHNMPLLFLQAISNTRRGFFAYMDFILMNCLKFSKKYVYINVIFEPSPLINSRDASGLKTKPVTDS